MTDERQNDDYRGAHPDELLHRFETLELRAKLARKRVDEAIRQQIALLREELEGPEERR